MREGEHTTRVLLVHRHAILREGVRASLASLVGTTVEEAVTGAQALATAQQPAWGVSVLDASTLFHMGSVL